MPRWESILFIRQRICRYQFFPASMSCLPSPSGPSGCDCLKLFCILPSPQRPTQSWAMLGNGVMGFVNWKILCSWKLLVSDSYHRFLCVSIIVWVGSQSWQNLKSCRSLTQPSDLERVFLSDLSCMVDFQSFNQLPMYFKSGELHFNTSRFTNFLEMVGALSISLSRVGHAPSGEACTFGQQSLYFLHKVSSTRGKRGSCCPSWLYDYNGIFVGLFHGICLFPFQ